MKHPLPAAAGTRPDRLESRVLDRYGGAARKTEKGLCSPSAAYDPALLEKVPEEIVEKDYGCGDPSRWVREGEAVVDLGSGSGKACYVLAQVVGPSGTVTGVDFNDAMLALARKHRSAFARRLGYDNLRFVKARIQDLALDLERAEEMLRERPVSTLEVLAAFEEDCGRLRRIEPLIPDATVDVVVSNCVLNLVRSEDKDRLFAEIHRVLRPEGRAVISDIVCDEDPPPEVLADADLWSGCIAGAFREDRLLERFEAAGFCGLSILERADRPWQVIQGVEFRSLTLLARKGKEGPCLERNQAVIYKGPWSKVEDDDGHRLLRGKRMAVCDKTFRLLTDHRGPYAGAVIGVEPREEVPLAEARPFQCAGQALRHPRETKGQDRSTVLGQGSGCCEGGSCS